MHQQNQDIVLPSNKEENVPYILINEICLDFVVSDDHTMHMKRLSVQICQFGFMRFI
jgi:hypothetical protein